MKNETPSWEQWTVAALGLASVPAFGSGQEGPVWGHYGQLNFGVLSVETTASIQTLNVLIRQRQLQQPRRLTMTQALQKRL